MSRGHAMPWATQHTLGWGQEPCEVWRSLGGRCRREVQAQLGCLDDFSGFCDVGVNGSMASGSQE